MISGAQTFSYHCIIACKIITYSNNTLLTYSDICVFASKSAQASGTALAKTFPYFYCLNHGPELLMYLFSTAAFKSKDSNTCSPPTFHVLCEK